MSNDNPVKTLLVELDCLLDTRLATVSRLNGAAAVKLLEGDAYWERDRDDFQLLTDGVITNAAFKDQYRRRDKDTLKRARPTGIVHLLRSICDEVEVQKLSHADIDSLKIDVNVYPYQLTEREQDVLCTAVMSYAGLETEIRVVNIAPVDLTPTRIRRDWDGVIIYDFDGWFTMHVEELNRVLIPRHLMFAPALYLKDPEGLEELPTRGEARMTPFTALEICMVERICLELLRAKEFSIVRL